MHADFSSQEYFRDPAAGIEKLRSAGPVIEVHFPIVGKVWTTTTQELADQVLKDSKTFTLRRDDGNVAGLQWWMPGIMRTLANSMLTMDEPDHSRLRDIVDEAFRRRAVLEMEPRIQALADELADELFAEGSPADLVVRYARKLPLVGDLRAARSAARRPADVLQMGGGAHGLHGRHRLPRRDPEDLRDEALHGEADRARAQGRRRRPDRRTRARRARGRQDQPRRDGLDAVPAAVRRPRDDHASHQRLGP